MPLSSRSPSLSVNARTRRPRERLSSSFLDFDPQRSNADAGPSSAGVAADLPQTPTTATFSVRGSVFDGNWLSTPMSRPSFGRRVSAGGPSSSPNPSFGQSLPTSMHTSARGSVAPQHDFLANWETLADLMVPGTQEGAARVRRRDEAAPPSSLRPSTTPSRSTLMNSPTQSMPELPEEEDSEHEPSLSGILSSSPTHIDTVMDSLVSIADSFEPQSRPQSQPQSPKSILYPRSEPRSRLPSEPPDLPPPSTPIKHSAPQWKERWKQPPWLTDVLKCGFAYFIASLFTFVPALSNLLSMQTETDVHGRVHPRPAYSAHMVATVVVYFNPARTLGNMILSTRYCAILAILSAIVSLISFGIVAFFDSFSPSHGSRWDWMSELGDWLVCILCVGGSMGGLAWAKLWVGNPAFNTGCSMAAVTVFTVIVKEGGWIKLKEVLLIVFIGACITNVVCFLIYPRSATTRLQDSMSKSLNSFSTLLDLLGSTFLLEKTVIKENRMPLADAVKSHGAAFKSLKANLADAKHERLVDPRMRGIKIDLYEAAIGSMARLAQHLAAMRSSTRVQEALLRAHVDGRISIEQSEKRRKMAPSVVGDLNELPAVTVEREADVSKSVELFLQLQRITGDDLDTLVERCDYGLDAVEAVITENPDAAKSTNIPQLRADVAIALSNFSRSSSRAIKSIYAGPRRRLGIYDSDTSESESDHGDHSLEVTEVSSDGPNEIVFLVYFFLFTLEEFARELLFLLDTVNDILAAPRLSAMEQVRSYVNPWRRKRAPQSFIYKQFQKLVPIDPSKLQPPLFPRNKRDERGTLSTPQRSHLSGLNKLYQAIWAFGARLKEPDMRYAIKTGVAGAMLAAPAFIESTHNTFLKFRGEWALIAFFASMSLTVGQTNFLSFFRVIGTITGGVIAVIACWLFPENPVALPIFGFLFSLPCFYLITQYPNYAQAGRFVLLTYNLTCLYAYNLREKDLEPSTIAFRRVTGVTAGVIWAGIVSRYWWPYTARKELRHGLSEFCLDLSYLYSKLVTAYSRGTEELDAGPESDEVVTENTPILPTVSERHHLGRGVRQFMAMELHLQGHLATLRGLLAHARNEPRLKGPFPFDFYHEVLLSCERMLDKLHSMRCVTTRHEWDQSVRQAFILPVNQQQREMAGNVILYFYILSAGFDLRTPLPPYLPPAEASRERLVEAIRSLDVVKRRSVRGGGRHLLFFAYALAMQEVIAELDYLGGLLQDAFGVISQSTVRDFEDLFVGREEDINIHAEHLARDSAIHL